MAITKIHPIKVNLKAALDYIENPDKTDDKMPVSYTHLDVYKRQSLSCLHVVARKLPHLLYGPVFFALLFP